MKTGAENKLLDDDVQTGCNQFVKIAKRLPRKGKVNLQSNSFSQKIPPIDPIPIRPPGYFDNCYSKEEIQEQNRLAKASVIRASADLE